MTDISAKLSAYLDGELEPADALEVEALLETDPATQAELDVLMAVNAAASEQFEALLNDPVPLSLGQKIKSSPVGVPAPVVARPVWGALAAGLVVFAFGGAGGYFLKDQISPAGVVVANAGWLNDIADYHAVYAGQQRHLVEVKADEADHIETWLGATVGAEFSIPDLSEFGLTFEGGRLLVANAKPVAQLMYRQPDGTVIALCLQANTKGGAVDPTFNASQINGFDFVSWNGGEAKYVVIGPQGQPNLGAIAARAAQEVDA